MKTLMILSILLLVGCSTVPTHYMMGKIAIDQATHRAINNGQSANDLANYFPPATDCTVAYLKECLPQSPIAEELSCGMNIMLDRQSKAFVEAGYVIYPYQSIPSDKIAEWVRGVASRRL